jgi:hypothetical protein
VSQVVLKEFTAPGRGSSGRQLLAFDLRHPERRHKLRTTAACGRFENFVAFESVSAEQLWCDVEQRFPAALKAVHAGTPFAHPSHVEALRDMVVLHYVRSYRYLEVHVKAFEESRAALRARLPWLYSEQLSRQAFRDTGLHLTGPEALGIYADRAIASSTIAQDHDSGKLFRTSIESAFRKVQQMVSTWQVEILTPESGQFLIGDNPGVTVHQDGRSGMAVGDATSMVLPIGPRHLVALGPRNVMGVIPAGVVEHLNSVQVRMAHRYVYMHPSSGLEAFATRAACERTALITGSMQRP